DILHTLDTHIVTNINASNLLELAQIAKDVDTSKITNLIFSDDPASVLYPDSTTGAFYLRPKDPTLTQIHTIAQNIFNDEVTKSAQGLIDQQPLIPQKPDDTKIEVQNGTWRPGFAARQEKKLEADGFKVTSIGNAAVRPLTQTQIYAVTQKNPATFEKLKKRYNAVELTTRPPQSPDNTSGTAPTVDIIVILGENAPDIAE
ncbi:MAG: LytR C-terminal domain-containing protein, partial [Candidatus Magasanikbacteria bacterium]|nr:LytR C-terminal domain-containing protein [Candidatus Magasanikbacteria bacterium]